MTLELVAAAVLSLDAAVVAAVVLGRWRARRTGGRWSTAPRSAEPLLVETAPAAPRSDPAANALRAEAASSVPQPGAASTVSQSTVSQPETAPSASRAQTPAADVQSPRNGWQAWVDPLTMAAEATAAWRRALRRDLLRAGGHRRGGAVLHVELDTPAGTAGDMTRLEGVLLDAIGSVVRPTDHFDHTGPGRFHVLLWDASTAGARAVGLRIEEAFGRSAAGPPGSRLVVGVESVTSEDEVSGAIRRAADEVARQRRASEGGATG